MIFPSGVRIIFEEFSIAFVSATVAFGFAFLFAAAVFLLASAIASRN